MSLVLQPMADGSPDDYHVLHNGLQIGRIYKRRAALRPENQWLWALNRVSRGPDALDLAGPATTLDEAQIALRENWNKWLARAHPAEAEQ